MYDVGVPMPIMSTYVPIDFRNLYLIGAHQQEAVNKAADQLNTAIQKFGEFHSPSDIDTENWYKLTLGNPVISGIINEAVSNPDALKDASWRSRLNAGLMGLDYGAMSRLQASKENMLLRQKANQELMLKGGYNPLLHDVDFANYDTLAANSGIFNDISPLPYMSTVDMVRPYVDNLKGRYLGKHDGFIFNGVADEDTDAQVNANWSSIITSPHYAQNLQLIKMQNPGISDEDAVKALNEQIFTAGREFAWNKPERDPLDMLYTKHRLEKEDKEPNLLHNLTDQLEVAAKTTFNTAFNGVATKEDARKKLNDLFTLSAKTTNSLNTAINDVLQPLTYNDLGPEANEILVAQGTQTGKTTSMGWRVGNSSSDFLLRKRLAENLMNRKIGGDNRLQRDFENGQFKNFLVAGSPSITTDGANIYHNKYIFIPESEIEGKYTAKEIAEIQGDHVELGDEQVRVNVSDDGYTQRTSINTLKPGKYIRIPASTIVPRMGQGAIENDAKHADERKVSQEMRDAMQALSEKRRLGLQ